MDAVLRGADGQRLFRGESGLLQLALSVPGCSDGGEVERGAYGHDQQVPVVPATFT
jgi:hypothetical protein